MIEAIFFDQDDTIVNTKKTVAEAYRAATDYLAEKSCRSKEGVWEEWRKIVEKNKLSKNPRIRSLTYSLGKVCRVKKWVEEAIGCLKVVLSEKLELNPGANEFFLKNKEGIKYILSTEDYPKLIELKMNKFGLKDKFDLIIGNKEVGRMKPDIKYLKIGWKKFNLNPKNCIYLGDRYDKDCLLGDEAGGITVLFGNKDERADYEIKNFSELEKIIEEN